MATAVEEELASGADLDAEYVDTHLVCCLDEDVAICGEDMTGCPEATDECEGLLCGDCIEVQVSLRGTCPFGKGCPDEHK